MSTNQQFRFHRQHGDEVEHYLSEAEAAGELVAGDAEAAERIFLDSFDWRLARSGRILELIPQQRDSWRLELIDRDSGRLLLAQPLARRPRGLGDLPAGPMRELLAPIVGVRSLLCEAYVLAEFRSAQLQNREGKTTLRLEAGHYLAHNGLPENRVDLGYWLLLRPVRGYDKALKKAARRLGGDPRFEPVEEDLFEAATRALGNRPLGYSSKLDVPLEADMPAWAALQRLLHGLLLSVRTNESGTCADRDPEFLHDFRVAVRRSRVLLGDTRGILPSERLKPFRDELRWLQQRTGRARDLDVYLLRLPDYRSQLDAATGDALQPLENLLRKEKRQAHLALARDLRSERYISLKRSWGQLVDGMADEAGDDHFTAPIRPLASRYIRRSYKRVIKAGKAIDDDSPAEALHDLRKRCKHLRYMLEFFQRLFTDCELGALIKALKGLQEVLGDFQDYEVQSHTLAEFEGELLATRMAGPDTIDAIQLLIAGLERRGEYARAHFGERFAAFADKGVRRRFDAIFAAGDSAS